MADEGNITLTSTTSMESAMRHALGDSWRTPPPDPPETKAAQPTIDVKDYIEQKNAEEHEKKHPSHDDEPEAGTQKLRRKGSGFIKQIHKLTARNYQAIARAEAAERERDELRAQLAGNGVAANPIAASGDGLADGTNQPGASESESQTSAEPSAQSQATPAQKAQYNREFSETARSIGLDLAKADQIGISPELEAAVNGVSGADSARLVDFFTKNPKLLDEIEHYPESMAENIKTLVNDLKVARGNGRMAPQSNAAAQTPEEARQYLGNSIRALGVDNWTDVLDHLDSNPEIRPGLLTLSAEQARARVKAIAAQLKASSQKPQKPRVQPPAPITPVGASAASAQVVPLDKLPPREYNRIRNEQERRRKYGR